MNTASHTYSLAELPNGLRVLHVPAPDKGSVCVVLAGKVGSRVEDDHELGAAHFLEHLFFDGTKRHPNALAINRFIDQTGASKNGYTRTETVEYYAKVISEKAEVAFDFISDIFLHSLLNDIDKERSVIAQEAAASGDDPYQLLFWQERPTLYPNQRLGRTFADEAANLPNITRDIVLNYYQRMYVAQNFILCITGGLDRSNAERWAKKYFSTIPSGKEVTFETPNFNPDTVLNIKQRDLHQAKVSVAFKGFNFNDPRATAAGMLGLTLGYGTSSRLFNRLRNQLHLVYSVSASHAGLSDTGDFAITTSMDEANLQQAVDEIINELCLLLKKGISSDELDKAHNISLSRLLFATENPATLGDIYTYRYLLTGKIKEVNEIEAEIKAVTKDDIMQAAQTIFSDPPKVNVITPKLTKLDIKPII